MKKILIGLTSLITIFSLDVNAQSKLWTLSNPLHQTRADELIVFTRTQLEKKLGKIASAKYVSIKRKNNSIQLQFDDLNKDEIWDEVAFLQNFQPNENITIQISIVSTLPKNTSTVKAHARHKRKNEDDSFGKDLWQDSIPTGQKATDFNKVALPPFLTEGPAWENDKVGFRIYFDERNGKDIWGKTTKAMVLDTVGINPANNYHEQSIWGMDILKVGKSLGAGSLALLYNTNGTDTLVRLGGVNMGKVIYQKIADGPVRAIFQLQYPQWKVAENTKPVSLTEQISIWGGQYFYQSKIILKNAPNNASLVTGIVNLKSKSLQQDTSLIYTFDTQSENHDKLAMAIALPPKQAYKVATTANEKTDVMNTHYVAMSIKNASSLAYRFYACWQQSNPLFKEEKTVAIFLKNEVKAYHQPILIK